MNAAPADDDGIVGKGPTYEPIRQAARDLVPLFSPWANPQPWWNLGMLGGVEPDAEGRHRVWISSLKQRGLGTETTLSLEQLRASAIGLLAYCEKHGDDDADV